MVQRKVPDKLGIQADHLSHDHISLKKPSSSQHQDGKNRLPDLKKKMMKKSRSSKLSDIGHQSLKTSTSSALKKSNVSQSGEPPPTLDVPTTSPTILLTPKKQIPITKTVESSPNYMKSTSCFDARRELQSSQVSLRRNSTNSRVVSSSSNYKKPTKTSSSKLVRSLIKTPSFKLSRPASSKKSPRVALCSSDHLSHVQRATCSSSLKDSKFPSYLMLNHGGTESVGTSVMKVCPYTYCSLNGHHHHHASLPPLKCFLSARRRLLKNQKSAKLAVPSDKGIKRIDEEDAAEKVSMDFFFIEIYAEIPKEDHEKKTDFVTVEGGGKEEAEHHIEEQVVESLSDGSPQSEIDADESPERYYEEIVTTETRIVEQYYVPPSDEEETDGTFTSGGDSEVTDMEWEEVKVSEAEIEDEAENSSEMGDESEPILGCSADESVNSHDVDVTEEENEEVIASFEGHFAEGDIKELNLEIEESGQVSNGLMLDQLSSTADEFEDVSRNEENLRLDEAAEYLDAFMDATSMEEQVQDQIEESEEGNVVLEVEDVIYLTSTQLCDASEGGNQKTEESSEMDKVEDDLSMESGVILEEAKEDADEANATEEIPSSDPLQATSEADEVVEKVEESSIDREILDSKDQNEKKHMTICEESVDHGDVKLNESEMAETKGENEDKKVGNKTKAEKKPSFLQGEEANDDQELHNKWNRSKRGIKDLEEESTRNFNPREPNYLPLVAEPGSEKVDLKHQMMEERKNSEEWMIDYALQQTVTKLAPARKKKVALLVEAFEAVMPVTKCESHRLSRRHHHHQSQAFPHAIRHIQACS